MKRLICLLLITALLASLCLALFSCGDNSGDGGSNTPETPETPETPDSPGGTEQTPPASGDGVGDAPNNPFDGGIDPEGWT